MVSVLASAFRITQITEMNSEIAFLDVNCNPAISMTPRILMVRPNLASSRRPYDSFSVDAFVLVGNVGSARDGKLTQLK